MKRLVSSAFLATAAVLTARSGSSSSVYYVGNSLVLQAEQRRVIQALAAEAGHQISYSMSVILGAPLSYIWQNPEASGGWEGQPYPQGLAPTNAWDALVLQPYDRSFLSYPHDNPSAPGYGENDVLMADNFYRLALSGNPRNQLYIYQVFPQRDSLTRIPEERSIEHSETIADRLSALHPDARPVLVIPAGLVIVELAAVADQGRLPHVPDHAGLYADATHLTEVGTYAVALTHLACFFQEDLRRYGTKPVFPAASTSSAGEAIWKDPAMYPLLGPNGGEVWRDTAEVIKRVVWNVVSNYARAGVRSTVGIKTTLLPSATRGAPYTARLVAERGTPPYRWTVSRGNLPPGLALHGDTVTGVASQQGDFAFTVTVTDSGAPAQHAESELTIGVGVPSQPFRIGTTSLPGAKRGTRYFQSLRAIGGALPVRWRVSRGSLPIGLSLNDAGVVQGSPGLAGTYAFTAEAVDSTPGAAQTATTSLVVEVAPAGAETMFATRTQIPPRIDGALDEPAWKLEGRANREVQGTTDNHLAYGALWDDGHLYIGIEVLDHNVVAPLADDGDAGDSVEIFVDGDNSKDAYYGLRQRYILVRPSGALFLPDGRRTGITPAATQTTRGYAIEIALPWSNFEITPYQNMTVGFDIANNDDDNGGGVTAQRFWFGDHHNRATPRTWGNLLLAGPTYPRRAEKKSDGRSLGAAAPVQSPAADAGCSIRNGAPQAARGLGWYAGALIAIVCGTKRGARSRGSDGTE